MKRRLILISLTLLGLLMILPRYILATVMVGHLVKSRTYGININYFTNHGYITQDKPIWYTHSAEGLAVARNRLVKTGQLEDIPILISIPSSVFIFHPKETELSLETKCQIAYGDTITEPDGLGRCYKIYYLGKDSYQDFLTLLVGLSSLTNDGQKITGPDLDELKKDFVKELESLKNITRHFDPTWSPNSHYLVSTVWQDGKVAYNLNDITTNKQSEIKLSKGSPVSSPLWSPDSKYLAIVSLKSITIFDTEKETSTSIDLPIKEKAMNNEALLSFDLDHNRLLIAWDTNLFSNYELLDYNLSTQEFSVLAPDIKRPEWGRSFQSDAYLLKDHSTSPDGTRVALIKEGQIVIEEVYPLPSKPIDQKASLTEEPEKGSRQKSQNKALPLIITGAGISLGMLFILVRKRKNRPPTLGGQSHFEKQQKESPPNRESF
jgi:hypothetical protein